MFGYSEEAAFPPVRNEKSASVADTSHAIAGSRAILSFTAFRSRCLQPR